MDLLKEKTNTTNSVRLDKESVDSVQGVGCASGHNKYAKQLAGHSNMPAEVKAWLTEIAAIALPESIILCDGSSEEWDYLTDYMVSKGSLIKLNPDIRPNSFLARSHPSDVARVESRTFICSDNEAFAGSNNNWREAAGMKNKLKHVFTGSMRGRKMYVVPFSMGAVGHEKAAYGIQITDSPYAVLNMHIMTRVSLDVLSYLDRNKWVKAVHSVGFALINDQEVARDDVAWPCNEKKYICHFPDSLEVWSYGSGYGGNALLSKKCFALRLASVMAKENSWLAEHMLIIKVTSPENKTYNIAAAFPSACGKTNLAMLESALPNWQVETIGDDIAWLYPDSTGRLRAINPEAGFFGVAPGTGYDTNPVAMRTIWGNTIFTNVALTAEGDVWWEGKSKVVPEGLIDWQGNSFSGESGALAAHPNARFTAPLLQCPSVADAKDIDEGVVIDAIVFGGRRASTVPLVMKAKSWQQGVLMGLTMSSELTAAQEGTVGVLRRDPFGMLPFCGYNLGDYVKHWLDIGSLLDDKAPGVFMVNWFRKSSEGKFLWPGFSENIRVIAWIIENLGAEVSVVDSPVGFLPGSDALNLSGLSIDSDSLATLLSVDVEDYSLELAKNMDFLSSIDNLPGELLHILEDQFVDLLK